MKQFRGKQICLGDCCFCDRLIVFLCRHTVFQIALHSQVDFRIVKILRLLWAICLLISMNGQFLGRNHSLDSLGSNVSVVNFSVLFGSCTKKMDGVL